MKKFLLFTFIFVLSGYVSFSQCSNCGSQFPAATQSTTSTSLTTVTTCAYAGEYSEYDVTVGETYTWTTCGNSYDTQLTLYTGGCGGTSLAYNDDDCGLQSTVTWTATYTGTVTLLLSEYFCSSNSTCTTIEWACTSCGGGGGTPPANDDPCSATPLTVNAACVNTTGTNVDATASAGVPAPGCASYSGGDVWYTVTVPANGSVRVETSSAGGFTDGGLALYSGLLCSSLSLIECDDDDGAGTFSMIEASGLTPGSTVWVRVWEYGNDAFGDFNICATEMVPPNVCGDSGPTMNTNDFCSTPATLTQGTGSFSSSTAATYSQDLPGNVNSVFCGSIENNSWYQFTALSTTESFSITSVLNCTAGIQAEVYDVTYDVNGCCTGFTSMSNCYNPASTALGTVTATGLTIGQDYMLMIDGNGGANCDFTISNWTGINILPVTMVNYTGVAFDSYNHLKWATSSEQENDYFTIEKSFDGINYTKVGTVKGNGNSSVRIDYEFKDYDVNHAVVYYRLTQTDFNGETKKVGDLQITREIANLDVYPNPFSESFTIDYSDLKTGSYELTITNLLGQSYSEYFTIDSKTGKFSPSNLSDLKDGVYFINVFDSSGKLIFEEKIVKH